MFAASARRGMMPHSHHVNIMTSNTPRTGKTSLTFESVVCTQLELQRRAASFSHRRSTMCRQGRSQYRMSSSSANHLSRTSNRIMLITPASSSFSTTSDITNQFLKTKNRSRTSSTNSMLSSRISTITDRQSFVSMFYWDALSRSPTIKKNESRWSLDFPKTTPLYWSLRSRLIEEYTESESLIEFAKKAILVLMKTKEAAIFICLILSFSIIMMGIGVSHLSDCPRQTNLPIYLFVSGIVWTTKLLQNIWHKYRLQQKRLTDEEPSTDHNDGHAFIDGLMTTFLIIWFFFGQYWLITIGYPPHFEQLLEDPDTWCHKTVVYGALISIIITYFLLITFISITLFLVFYTRYTIIKRASVQ